MADVETITSGEVAGVERSKSFADRFIGETVILAVTTAFLFLLGYLFFDGWMSVYDVPTWIVDCPSYTFLVYSLLPITKFTVWAASVFTWLYCFGIVLVLVNAFSRGLRDSLKGVLRIWLKRLIGKKRGPKLPKIDKESGFAKLVDRCGIPFMYSIWCICLFFVMTFVAIQSGQHFGNDEYNHGMPVHLIFNANVLKSLDSTVTKANDNGDLRLMTQTKDLVIVFVKPGSELDKKPKRVFIFRRADLSSVQWCEPSKGQVCGP